MIEYTIMDNWTVDISHKALSDHMLNSTVFSICGEEFQVTTLMWWAEYQTRLVVSAHATLNGNYGTVLEIKCLTDGSVSTIKDLHITHN